MKKKIFITGTDTDIGKTYTTGLMLKFLFENKINAVTQKPIQTGNKEFSEDIIEHYKIANAELANDAIKKLQNPYSFSLPASPHLSSKEEGIEIDLDYCNACTEELASLYDFVLVEGAGGLMVPLNSKTLTYQYIQKYKLPIVLVSSSKLGSINHTLLNLYLIKNLGLDLKALIYNKYFDSNPIIEKDSLELFDNYLVKEFPGVELIEINKDQQSVKFDFLLN